VLGVIFGVLQMALHAIYRKGNTIVMEEEENDTSVGKLSSDIQSCNGHAFIIFTEASDKGPVATPSAV